MIKIRYGTHWIDGEIIRHHRYTQFGQVYDSRRSRYYPNWKWRCEPGDRHCRPVSGGAQTWDECMRNAMTHWVKWHMTNKVLTWHEVARLAKGGT